MILSTFLGLFAAPIAEAHITLLAPVKRYDSQKSGPCGSGSSDARTDNVTTYIAGETITVEWQETINHPSHYRIAFDADGVDDFVDPATELEFYSNAAVLLDEIPDDPSGSFAVQVTLPDVECDNCTLQVIQVMYDKPPYVPGTNDLYYQCADLVLVAGTPTGTTSPTTPTGPTVDTGVADDTGDAIDGDADAKDGGCGCTAHPTPLGAAGVFIGGAMLAWRRRR